MKKIQQKTQIQISKESSTDRNIEKHIQPNTGCTGHLIMVTDARAFEKDVLGMNKDYTGFNNGNITPLIQKCHNLNCFECFFSS